MLRTWRDTRWATPPWRNPGPLKNTCWHLRDCERDRLRPMITHNTARNLKQPVGLATRHHARRQVGFPPPFRGAGVLTLPASWWYSLFASALRPVPWWRFPLTAVRGATRLPEIYAPGRELMLHPDLTGWRLPLLVPSGRSWTRRGRPVRQVSMARAQNGIGCRGSQAGRKPACRVYRQESCCGNTVTTVSRRNRKEQQSGAGLTYL